MKFILGILMLIFGMVGLACSCCGAWALTSGGELGVFFGLVGLAFGAAGLYTSYVILKFLDRRNAAENSDAMAPVGKQGEELPVGEDQSPKGKE